MTSRRASSTQSSDVVAGASDVDPALIRAVHQAGVQAPGKEGLIARSDHFLDLETPPEFLKSWITQVAHFFVRSHLPEPLMLAVDQWRLSIGGEVDNPLS